MKEIEPMDGRFAAALRLRLEALPTAARRRRLVWLGVGGVSFAVLLTGTTALATGILSVPGGREVVPLTAPSRVIPSDGSSSDGSIAASDGVIEIDLGARPAGADAVEVTLVCLSAGSFFFEDGSGMTCADADVGTSAGTGHFVVDLDTEQDTLTLEVSAGATWDATTQYVSS
ncbi:MAG: hypothetical protein QM635_02700 [Microbacteriaceae bacterium]